MNIAGIEIGRGHPCRTVAEISNNHNGDKERAFKLIEAAQDAGADFVKFQCYTPAELVALRGDGPAPEPWGSDGWTMRRLYEKAATPLTWFPELISHCDVIGIPWFSSVFGNVSLGLMEAMGCPAYKLASLDSRAKGLYRLVKSTGKPIIRSLPTPRAPRTDDLTLYCPPGYPQVKIPNLVAAMRSHGGFSYHGTSYTMPVIAAAMGASLLECHFHLWDDPSELEPAVSLTNMQFASMVAYVRDAEEVLK